MRRKWMLFLFALSVALNIPFVAMWGARTFSNTMPHQPWGPPPSHNTPKHGAPHPEPPSAKAFMASLGVSDSQWEKMADRQAQFHRKLGECFQKLDRLNSELFGAVAADGSDVEMVEAKKLEIIEAQRALQELFIGNLLADKRDLTPEQFEKLMIIVKERRPPGPGPHAPHPH